MPLRRKRGNDESVGVATRPQDGPRFSCWLRALWGAPRSAARTGSNVSASRRSATLHFTYLPAMASGAGAPDEHPGQAAIWPLQPFRFSAGRGSEDPRRDRLDRRQLHVVIGAREHLVGGAQFRAAGAALGVDVARHVGVGAELACYPGVPFAASLLGRRVPDVGLLSARWRQRRVRRRLRRLAGSALKFGDARQ